MIPVQEDTIAAISTPPGEGGIGIIRLSGPEALSVSRILFSPTSKVSSFESHRLYHGYILNPQNKNVMDEVMMVWMQGPKSYTGEDVVEISAHGGMVNLQCILQAFLESGARLAEPGEFTKRAFLNGSMDLAQAEAVIDVIRSRTERSLAHAQDQLQGKLSKEVLAIKGEIVLLLAMVEAAVDFPEEEIEEIQPGELRDRLERINSRINSILKSFSTGRIFQQGVNAMILGRPNVGKSSLFNVLLQKERAIVTSSPGTTRDTIEVEIDIHGIPVRLIDSAGIRETGDVVEKEGVRVARERLKHAELILLIIDHSEPLQEDDRRLLQELQEKEILVVMNKTDLPVRCESGELSSSIPKDRIFSVSAKYGTGIERLEKGIVRFLLGPFGEQIDSPVILTTLRHKQALEKALDSIALVNESLEKDMSPEFLALDLRGTLDHIGEIVGEITTEEILELIFNQFCIGK